MEISQETPRVSPIPSVQSRPWTKFAKTAHR